MDFPKRIDSYALRDLIGVPVSSNVDPDTRRYAYEDRQSTRIGHRPSGLPVKSNVYTARPRWKQELQTAPKSKPSMPKINW